ncbi:n-myristoyltransferase 2, putative [Ichthyophthirius multifiliis]|uniref:Glycylpeptide N-tetradecanoyltransferase n=1 Tax=Ichthyophthirius multifiliis TaxID=5932 RepID=G0QW95_ICHMU|nr:n-myristoyltransferase 2, putative [Ichthyophthirius multifiliis]EGR30518.1 n-myristoyltransferase 2, putative [Ichthyophthirius multifiliis]|eukprot:XP_004032105.1 n-myristoyltransferase 2, putative [Ichthyophthirius multifiliis]
MEDKDSFQKQENQQQNQNDLQKNQDNEEQKNLNQNLLRKQLQLGSKENTLLSKDWKFWKTQPVVQFDEDQTQKSGPIDLPKEVKDIRQEPYNIPTGFVWSDLNLEDSNDLDQLYTLLVENYVEDDDNMFRFDYSREFLKWALTPPGQYKDWTVGVRVQKTGKLVGFISGIPVTVIVEQKDKIKMTEINFLCVNKKLRSQRLAPVLIKEITRRVNIKNMWQAIYTAGVVIPKPVSYATYYHRSLHPKKLIEINFSSLGKNQTIARVQKLYKLPEETNIPGLREMKKKDIGQVTVLLNTYLKKFSLYNVFTEEDIKHYMIPIPNVIYSYVVEDKNKKVTDFFSFYSLPSTIIKHPKHNTLRAAYSYYNVATVTPLTQLIENALILAKKYDFDVFNALNLMDNQNFLEELKFSPGDGNLHYYLYNWRIGNKMEANQLGMVLV